MTSERENKFQDNLVNIPQASHQKSNSKRKHLSSDIKEEWLSCFVSKTFSLFRQFAETLRKSPDVEKTIMVFGGKKYKNRMLKCEILGLLFLLSVCLHVLLIS